MASHTVVVISVPFFRGRLDACDISVEQLERAVKCNPGVLQSWLDNGDTKRVRSDTLAKVAKALGATPSSFIASDVSTLPSKPAVVIEEVTMSVDPLVLVSIPYGLLTPAQKTTLVQLSAVNSKLGAIRESGKTE